MTAIVRNVSGTPITLSGVYQGILLPGSGAVIDDTVNNVIVNLGGVDSIKGIMTVEFTNSSVEVARGLTTQIDPIAPWGLAEDLTTVEVDLAAAQSDIADIQIDVGTLQTDSSQLRLDVDADQFDIAALQTDVAALQTDVAGNTADISTLQTDLGTLQTDSTQLRLDVDQLQFDAVKRTFSIPFTLPAPTGSAYTKDVLAFSNDLLAGTGLTVKVIPNDNWAAGDAVGDKYLVSSRRYNNTPGNIGFTHDLLTGVDAGDKALLPTGADSALLTAGQNLTVVATGSSVLLTNAVPWVITPGIGDYISITSASTAYRGATKSNPGVYVVTLATSTTITATKLYGSDPESVGIAAAGASDVAAVRAIAAVGASFDAGDVIGLRIIVPIDTTTPVDVSPLSLLAVFTYDVA